MPKTMARLVRDGAEVALDLTKEEAIAIMCRRLAALCEQWGHDIDADAVRLAERVLVTDLNIGNIYVRRLERENADLRAEVEELRAAALMGMEEDAH